MLKFRIRKRYCGIKFMRFLNLLSSYNNSAKLLLKAGSKSPDAFERALDQLDRVADRLHDFVEKRMPHLYKEDTTPMSLQAEVASDSIGTHTLAYSSLSASLIQREHYSIALAKAVSVAAAEGDAEVTSVSTFTQAPGADITFTKVRTFSGENFEAAAEIVFALDFDFLELPGLDVLRTPNRIANNLRADIDDGNVATVNLDLEARGDNTSITTDIDTLAISDILSSTSISADLYVT